MDRYINSDMTMVASQNFDSILEQIKRSCLNLSLKVTPFSAEISLKKTVTTDKTGTPIARLKAQCVHSEESLAKIKSLEAKLNSSNEKYVKLLMKFEAAEEVIEKLTRRLEDSDETIINLEKSNLAARSAADKMNKALIAKVDAFTKEKSEIVKEYKGQVKTWRKELGKANAKHINLEKRLDLLTTTDFNSNTTDYSTENFHIAETQQQEIHHHHHQDMFTDICSICALGISDYVLEYFCGEVVNPACDECKIKANLSEEDWTMDPFSSFPSSGIPISLVSHWTPPYAVTKPSLVSIPSFEAHYMQTAI